MYVDHAATTPVRPEVLATILPCCGSPREAARMLVRPRAGRRVLMGRRAVGLVALVLSACGGPRPTPGPAPTSTPAPAPTATLIAAPNPTSATQPQAQPTLDPTSASPSEVENALLSNVDDLIAEAADLAVTPCEDLIVVIRENPNLLPSIRGFAAAVKRIGATQAVLNTDTVKAGLSDLDHSMGELEGALNLCGIKPP
jgi:hypothetical protein